MKKINKLLSLTTVTTDLMEVVYVCRFPYPDHLARELRVLLIRGSSLQNPHTQNKHPWKGNLLSCSQRRMHHQVTIGCLGSPPSIADVSWTQIMLSYYWKFITLIMQVETYWTHFFRFPVGCHPNSEMLLQNRTCYLKRSDDLTETRMPGSCYSRMHHHSPDASMD